MKRLAAFLVLLILGGCAATPVPAPKSFAEQVVSTTVVLQTSEGQTYCSGTAVSPVLVVTATHCLFDEKELFVKVEGGKSVKAVVKVKGDEWGKDIAVIAITEGQFKDFSPIGPLDSVKRGDTVYIVGAPYGELEFSFGKGVVAHTNRMLVELDEFGQPMIIYGPFFQIYAESRGGNSGGGMFNEKGELVGVVVRSDGKGLTFVIPMKTLYSL